MYECKCKLCRGFCYLKEDPTDPLDEEFIKCPECYVECLLQDELDRADNSADIPFYKKAN